MTKHRHVWLSVWRDNTWREVCMYACGVGYRRVSALAEPQLADRRAANHSSIQSTVSHH